MTLGMRPRNGLVLGMLSMKVGIAYPRREVLTEPLSTAGFGSGIEVLT